MTAQDILFYGASFLMFTGGIFLLGILYDILKER